MNVAVYALYRVVNDSVLMLVSRKVLRKTSEHH